jgi:hypothetical protein
VGNATRDPALNTLGRIGVWFASLFLSVAVFCLLFPIGSLASFFFLFRITLTFALPVSLLYLPVVAALKDAQRWRLCVLLVSGILIGPACLGIWGLILQLRGTAVSSVWRGDGMATGLLNCMVFALIVGSLTTTLYETALEHISRRSVI